MKRIGIAILSIALITLTACGSSSDDQTTTVKVGVVGEYNKQWDTINELLKEDNIKVELVKYSDYAAPNRALNDGDIDLNAFQHKAYLENDKKTFGYEIESIGDTIFAPLAIYNNNDNL